jgi:hypothetical protein
MARIVIEVDELTGKKWNYASPQTRQKISKEFSQLMKATLSKSEDDFWPFLEEVRKRAEGRGFDDEILNQILSEE